jgi:hypothetical protein
MRLSKLKELLSKAETMGFNDEEIEVDFRNTFTNTEMALVDTKVTVTTTEDNCRPVLAINLKTVYPNV